MNRFLSSKWTKAVLFLLALVPLGVLLWWCWEAYSTGDFTEYVTANPIEFITHYTGDWTIRFLCITLCDHAAADAAQPSADHPLPPDDGTVRVLLRQPAFHRRGCGWIRGKTRFPPYGKTS